MSRVYLKGRIESLDYEEGFGYYETNEGGLVIRQAEIFPSAMFWATLETQSCKDCPIADDTLFPSLEDEIEVIEESEFLSAWRRATGAN